MTLLCIIDNKLEFIINQPKHWKHKEIEIIPTNNKTKIKK